MQAYKRKYAKERDSYLTRLQYKSVLNMPGEIENYLFLKQMKINKINKVSREAGKVMTSESTQMLNLEMTKRWEQLIQDLHANEVEFTDEEITKLCDAKRLFEWNHDTAHKLLQGLGEAEVHFTL